MDTPVRPPSVTVTQCDPASGGTPLSPRRAWLMPCQACHALRGLRACHPGRSQRRPPNRYNVKSLPANALLRLDESAMKPETKQEHGPKRILSGVQPSGKLHLGNYFGAVKQHIELQ